jgi:hypothetical protein
VSRSGPSFLFHSISSRSRHKKAHAHSNSFLI